MTNNKSARLWARLEMGFHADSIHLQNLARDLAIPPRLVLNSDEASDPASDWPERWCRHWDGAGEALRQIREQVQELDTCMTGGRGDRSLLALEAWKIILIEDARLMGTLDAIQAQADGLYKEVPKDWSRLTGLLELHLEMIRACFQSMRIKLELLKEHSPEDTEQLVREILARAAQAEPEATEPEPAHRQTTAEMKVERYHLFDFLDVAKRHGQLVLMESVTPAGA